MKEVKKLPENIAFFLLKPDTSIRNLVIEILDYIKIYIDYEIIDYRIGKLSKSQFNLMYSPELKWIYDDWDLNFEIYSYAPAIGIVIKSLRKGTNLQLELKKIQGHAVPKKIKNKHSIRYKFNAYSRLFNLIHVPDDNAKAYVEFKNWIARTSDYSLKIEYIKLSDLSLELQNHDYLLSNRIDEFHTFCILKIRICHFIISEYPIQNLISEYSSFLLKSKLSILKCKTNSENRSQVINELEKNEKNILFKLMQIESKNSHYKLLIELLSLLFEFTSQQQITHRAIKYFWAILDMKDVFYSDIEKSMINSYLLYEKFE